MDSGKKRKFISQSYVVLYGWIMRSAISITSTQCIIMYLYRQHVHICRNCVHCHHQSSLWIVQTTKSTYNICYRKIQFITNGQNETSSTSYDTSVISVPIKGYCYQIKQFFWPRFDQEDTNMDKHQSRLYAAVYLGLSGIIAIFQVTMNIQGVINPML